MSSIVLVLDCGRNGLGLIRSLAVENNHIIGVDFSKTPGLFSRYLNDRYIIKNPKENSEEFISELCEIGSKHNEKIYLFLTKNSYIELFNQHIDSLKPYFIPTFLTDAELYDQCSNKLSYAQLFKNSGINLPKQFSHLDTINEDDFPLIIKPEKLAANSDGKMVFKIRICSNKEELSSSVSDLAGVDYVIQEVIPGGDDSLYTCGVVAIDGLIKACFTGKKVRQFPPLIGEASYAKSVVDAELVNLATEICKRTQFTGIAQIEFKKYNGNYYFIEMNPRAYSWNSLATYCGVNLPLILLHTLKRKDHSMKSGLMVNTKEATWSFFYEDLLHNCFLNKNVGVFKLIRQSYASKTHAYYSLKDFKPVIAYYLFDGLNLIKHAIKLKRRA